MFKFKVFLLLIFCTLLNSCSYLSSVFIQNLTNEDVKIYVKFDYSIDNNTLSKLPSLHSSKKMKVRDFNNDENKILLEYKKINQNSILVVLPKNSITEIDGAINKKTNITEIIIENSEFKEILDRNKFIKKAKSQKGNLIYYLK